MYRPHTYAPATDRQGPRAAFLRGCHPRTQSVYKNESQRVEFQVLTLCGEGPRWTDWSSTKPAALLVAGLYLRADFIFPVESNSRFDNFRIEFDPVGSMPMGPGWLADMARTARKLEKRAQVHPRSGSSVDVAIWAVDLFKSIGVEKFARYTNDKARGDLSFSTVRVLNDGAPNLIAALDEIARP